MRWAVPTHRVLAVASVALLVGVALVVGAPQPAPSAPSVEMSFENATESSGLDYRDVKSHGISKGNAGVHVLDANGDAWLDLLTTGGPQPALWINHNGSFERSDALPRVEGHVKSAAVVDYDGDGRTDVLLLRAHAAAVALHNEGDGFVRDDVGLGNFSYPLGAASADYDGDGDRDLFVFQGGDWNLRLPAGYLALDTYIADDNGNPNYLFENVGGEFRRVDSPAVAGDRWSFAATFADVTGDGHPDIHVANDYNLDLLYVNRGNGTFRARTLPNSTGRNGMDTQLADVNGDGHMDLYVTNIMLPMSPETMGEARYNRVKMLFSFQVQSSRTKGNNLLINQGNGTFVDRAESKNVRVGGWAWAASYSDLNNDGHGDIVTATQNIVPIYPERTPFFYPQVFEHRANDTFVRRNGSAIGLGPDDSRGMVAIDYDHDGDRDLIFANFASRFTVYENRVDPETTSLLFDVVDASGDRAWGARVRVEAGHVNRTYLLHRENGYQSTEPSRMHVGLGRQTSATLHVTWPDGTERTFDDVPAGQYVRLSKRGVQTVYEFEDAGPS